MSMDHGTLEFYSRVITILVAVNVCMLSYCIDGMCACNLIFSSNICSPCFVLRARHLMTDLRTLLPHSRAGIPVFCCWYGNLW